MDAGDVRRVLGWRKSCDARTAHVQVLLLFSVRSRLEVDLRSIKYIYHVKCIPIYRMIISFALKTLKQIHTLQYNVSAFQTKGKVPSFSHPLRPSPHQAPQLGDVRGSRPP